MRRLPWSTNCVWGVVGRVSASSGATVVVKLPIPSQDWSIELLRREVRAYWEFNGDAGLVTPTMLHGSSDPGRPSLVLADLGSLRPGDDVTGCDIPDAHRVMAELGRFHRRWTTTGEALDGLVANGVAVPFRESLDRLVDRILAAIPAGRSHAVSLAGPPAGEVVDALADQLDEIAGLGDPPLTLVHGDFRLDNIFFDNDWIVVIDWSGLRVGRGAIDLGGFLARCLSDGPSDDELDELIATYRAELISSAGPSIPAGHEQIGADAIRGAWYWMAWALVVLTSIPMSPGPTMVVETWIRRLTPILHRSL